MLRRSVLPLCLGLLTVPVAAFVGIMLFPNGQGLSSTTTPGRTRAESRGWTWYDATLSAEADIDLNAAAYRQLRECRADTYSRPPWADSSDPPPELPTTNLRIEAWGVPFRSFWGWHAYGNFASRPPTPSGIHHGGDLLPYFAPNSFGSGTRVFPFLPLWPGLIANTLIFAAAWGGLFSLLRAARRALRRRRNLCPACAYDLRQTPPGSPCPECGAATAHKVQ